MSQARTLRKSELKQLIKSSPLKTESLILLNSVVLEDRMARKRHSEDDL